MPDSYTARDRDPMVIWLNDIGGVDARGIAGGKGASLAQMASAGLPVPPGFVVSAEALRSFLANDGLSLILRLLDNLDIHDGHALAGVSRLICDWMTSRPVPTELKASIAAAYHELAKPSPRTQVAVRSSGIGEDGEAASFAGQQETFLNVSGIEAVISKVVECWISFFSPRAIFYRGQKGSLAELSMAVVVQEMVQADKSGVMFTVDPIHKNPDHVVIEAVYGLGEGIVSGMITPDHYIVHRQQPSVFHEVIAEKRLQIVWDSAENVTLERPVAPEKRNAAVLAKDELLHLRDLGLGLESHFGKPQDIEWCARHDQFFLLQSRPITTL
jgi:pyruvate, water dikinase